MDGQTRRHGYGPNPGVLLRVSENFLRLRHFDDCRKYALQSHELDPTLPGVAEILAVADVMLASRTRIAETQTDWYAILQVNRYSQDSNLITECFNNLNLLLNPKNNKFPFADQAYELVHDAWYVLSNPVRKSEFDNEFNKHNGHVNGEKMKEKCDFKGDSFWTVCPYCYYVYEYPRVYEDCCLRCTNEKCAKGFHGMAIQTPPMEVLRDGKYICPAFIPLGFQAGEGKTSSWNPFVPKKNAEPEDENVCTGDNFVEISDDSDNSCTAEFDVSAKKEVTEELNESGEKIRGGVKSAQTEVPPVVKPARRRKKKSVAKNTKKLMGTGNRIKKQEIVGKNADPMEVNAQASDDDKDIGSGFVGGMEMVNEDEFIMGEVEFFDADDDILVSLHDGI